MSEHLKYYTQINETKDVPSNRKNWRFRWTLVRTVPTLSWFPFFHKLFFGTNFSDQGKNNVIETISCLVDQLSKKYCVYYVSEHLKYYIQINETKVVPSNRKNWRFCWTLVRTAPTLSCFPCFFFWTNFRDQNKNNDISCKKNIAYIMYVCEHLKYNTQINEIEAVPTNQNN